MSSSASEPTLHLGVSPSRRLAAILLASHLGAAAVLLGLPVPLWLALAVAISIAVSFYRSYRRHASLRARRAVCALAWAPDGSWQVSDSAGNTHAAVLQPDYVALPGLVILRLRLRQRDVRTAVLLADSLNRETARRLRARLRLAAASAHAGPRDAL